MTLYCKLQYNLQLFSLRQFKQYYYSCSRLFLEAKMCVRWLVPQDHKDTHCFASERFKPQSIQTVSKKSKPDSLTSKLNSQIYELHEYYILWYGCVWVKFPVIHWFWQVHISLFHYRHYYSTILLLLFFCFFFCPYGYGFFCRGFTNRCEILHGGSAASQTGFLPFWLG